MKKLLKRFLCWIFSEELAERKKKMDLLDSQLLRYKHEAERLNKDVEKARNLLRNVDVSVDVHRYSSSWAVISLQGQKTDYVKFIDLKDKDLRDIGRFLSQYDRRKIDINPGDRQLLNDFFRI